MKTARFILLAAGLAAAGGLVAIAAMQAVADRPGGGCPILRARAAAEHATPSTRSGKCQAIGKAAPTAPKYCPMCRARSERAARLQQAIQAIDAAAKAIQAGEHKTATAELDKARQLVAETHKALAPLAMAGPVVNARCPMMGSPIDPAKVPADLRRAHRGRVVGFCCAGCPAAWDKLTDDQKDAKLSGAMGG